MIKFEVHDEEFVTWLDSLQYKIQTMTRTLMEIAKTVEMQGRKFVPVDTTRLEQSFKAVPVSETSELIAVEMGYSALASPIAPKTSFDYAEYVHIGIDHRTGKPLNFQKPSATPQYLYKAIDMAMAEGWVEIKGDYLSLFRG